MAKFGEGDPRWLVEERPDGANVNNWHWTEKDCLQWTKDRLEELFNSAALADGDASVRATSPVLVKGEVFINIRKNKMIPSYELDIVIPWEGEVKSNGQVVGTSTGKVQLPYLADENHDENPEIRVLCDENGPVAQQLKEAILAEGKKVVHDKIKEYLHDLKSGKAAGAAAPSTSTPPKAAANAAPAGAPAAQQQQVSKPKTSSTAASRSSLKLSEKYYAGARDLYDCFTIENKLKAYTQSNGAIQPTPGGKFTWYNGTVEGEFVELVPNKKLVMKWRFNTWADNCFSKVTLEFEEPEPGNTRVVLRQTDIPDSDRFGNEDVLDVTEKGWKSQVFSRIRQVFGYGV